MILCVFAALATVWYWTPLHEKVDVDALVIQASVLRQSYWAPIAVVAIYVAAGLVVFPVMLLIAATGIVFGPLLGALYAFMGALASAATGYGLGRILGRETVRQLAGPRVKRLMQHLATRGFVAMSIVRIIPVAPFTIVNFVAGASLIGCRDFLLGTVVGMTPGIVVTVVFVDRLAAAFNNPDGTALGWVAGIAALAIIGSVLLRRLFNDRGRNAIRFAYGQRNGNKATAAAAARLARSRRPA